ncbi:hypothetical protein K2Z83_21590 [Oscillochloris sp. ZM17-4]|uniref:hypothetical protein n=1 Tax=Oscillochloris sp. ZM17-4 TaxID=2866714 RepID=UPI001C73419F|nr:hypothetical protein [Oscillochloris sp. ZM17-4]MBX0330265.1 hypothetical protein [Oscillochloris sp. ZM17-4]
MPARLWLLLLALLLAGCAPAAPAAPARQIQLVADPAPILAALPPDVAAGDVAAPPAPVDPVVLAAWGDPAAAWRDMARQAAALDGLDEAGVRAELAALDAAMSDGLALADLARAEGHAIADEAVLAEVAARQIARAHPLRADAARDAAPTAAWAGCWRGDASAPAVVAGRLLGAALADALAAQEPTNDAPAAAVRQGR